MKTLAVLCAALILGMAIILGAQNSQAPGAVGVVRGKITFEGALPPARMIYMSSDPVCAASSPQVREPPEDVVVYAQPLRPATFPIPSETVVLEFRDCRYTPRTVTLQTGQNLVIRNADATVHNTHAWPVINKPFNVALAVRGSETRQVFAVEESRPFPIRDDIHNWESAYIGVFSHPYHAVAKLNQAYQFSLPPGSYELAVWHEQFRSQMQTVEVRAGEVNELNWILK